jgi:hypothetical protein
MARTRAWKRSARGRSKVTQGLFTERRRQDPDLSEPPETWGQTSLLRGALLTSDATGDQALTGESTAFSDTHVSLIDRAGRGQLGWKPKFIFLLAVLLWFGVGSYILLQDNAAGKLETLHGFQHFGLKMGGYGLFGLIALAVAFLGAKFFDSRSFSD